MKNDDHNDADDSKTASVNEFGKSVPPDNLRQIGRFKIEYPIGSGGMGTVYKAYDESMKRVVALKVLHPSLDLTESAKARFVREAWIAGQLQHPNIIRVYSRGEYEKFKYIEMEYAERGSLVDYIGEVSRSVPPGSDFSDTMTGDYIRSILEKFIELTSAVEHVHSHGFIHRDIKPHNILLSGERFQFKLTDFGVAHAEDFTHITRAGDFIGTVKYMSPELLTAHRATVDLRTDIYSLGITLYETLTLTLPYEADSEEKLITSIISGKHVKARIRNRRVPRDLETVLMKSTHIDPDARYQCASEFAEDLRRVLDSRPIAAKREGPLAKGLKYARRNKRVLSLSALALIVVSALAIWYLRTQQLSTDRDRIISVLQDVRAQTVEEGVWNIESLPQDWDHLAPRLYSLMQSDEEVLREFLRAYARVTWSFYRRETDSASARLDFNTSLESVIAVSMISQLHENPLGVMRASASVSVDEGPIYESSSQSLLLITDYRGNNGFGGTKLGDIAGPLNAGKHDVYVRIIKEYFLSARIIDRSTGEEQSMVSSDSASAEYSILSANGAPASIYFADTAYGHSSIWIFDEFPDDFPRMICDDSIRQRYKQQFDISRLDIVLDTTESHKYYSSIRWVSKGSEYLAVPLAGWISLQTSDRTLLDKGISAVMGNQYLNLGLIDTTRGSTSMKSFCPDSTRVHIKNFDPSPFKFRDVSDLIENGETPATLRIDPSRDVARTYPRLDKFFGLPMSFNVIVSARYANEADTALTVIAVDCP